MSLTLLHPSTPHPLFSCDLFFSCCFSFLFFFLVFCLVFFQHTAFVEFCPHAAFSNPELEELAYKGFFLSKTKKVLPSEKWSSEAS